ncbi:MAG: LytTR family transcriptional regulator [Cyclobacteriaceae bacterium]|nr:LytTR family transcriptional regulator [Cyclobacteriaceae bacterium]
MDSVTFVFYLLLDWFEQQQTMARLEKELGDLKTQALPVPSVGEGNELVVKSGTARVKINVNEVTHVQGLKDYSIIFWGNERVIVKGSLKSVELVFPAGRLVRVHKSYLVALGRIQQVHANKVTVAGMDIPVGRIYKPAVVAIFASNQK